MTADPHADDAQRAHWFQEACIEADYRWHVFIDARRPLDQAQALMNLQTAMHDMRTYLPGYDYETGTLPWEREDES